MFEGSLASRILQIQGPAYCGHTSIRRGIQNPPNRPSSDEIFVRACCVHDTQCFAFGSPSAVTSIKVNEHLSQQLLPRVIDKHIRMSTHRCPPAIEGLDICASFLDEIPDGHAPYSPTCPLHASQQLWSRPAQKVRRTTLLAATSLLSLRSSPSSLVSSWQSIG